MIHLGPLNNNNQRDGKHGPKQNIKRQRYAKEHKTMWQNRIGQKKNECAQIRKQLTIN
jgi:hypothetical protein